MVYYEPKSSSKQSPVCYVRMPDCFIYRNATVRSLYCAEFLILDFFSPLAISCILRQTAMNCATFASFMASVLRSAPLFNSSAHELQEETTQSDFTIRVTSN